uniref:Uncharacterized protein n=1 Tax=Octopus bimaculoides TaxID=37653 RepID=A0A0L8IAP4_OCTBM
MKNVAPVLKKIQVIVHISLADLHKNVEELVLPDETRLRIVVEGRPPICFACGVRVHMKAKSPQKHEEEIIETEIQEESTAVAEDKMDKQSTVVKRKKNLESPPKSSKEKKKKEENKRGTRKKRKMENQMKNQVKCELRNRCLQPVRKKEHGRRMKTKETANLRQRKLCRAKRVVKDIRERDAYREKFTKPRSIRKMC